MLIVFKKKVSQYKICVDDAELEYMIFFFGSSGNIFKLDE